jgi:hypothetical protein
MRCHARAEEDTALPFGGKELPRHGDTEGTEKAEEVKR